MEITPALTTLDLVLRIGAATLAGSIIGLNRDLRRKPAGLRTHALVSIGAAGITLLALAVAWDGNTLAERRAVSQVLQGIITGIGFLGGGVILRDLANKQIHGLTTAATIWMAAALGMVFGAAYWNAGCLMIAFMFFVLVPGEFIENAMLRLWDVPKDDNERNDKH